MCVTYVCTSYKKKIAYCIIAATPPHTATAISITMRALCPDVPIQSTVQHWAYHFHPPSRVCFLVPTALSSTMPHNFNTFIRHSIKCAEQCKNIHSLMRCHIMYIICYALRLLKKVLSVGKIKFLFGHDSLCLSRKEKASRFVMNLRPE